MIAKSIEKRGKVDKEIGKLLIDEHLPNPLIRKDRLEIFRRMRALNVIGNLGANYNRWPELVEYVGYCHLLLGNIYPKIIEPFNRKGKKKKNQKRRVATKREAFQKWVIDNQIDIRSSLDSLLLEAEEAFQNGKLPMKIGRNTIYQVLKPYRKKKVNFLKIGLL